MHLWYFPGGGWGWVGKINNKDHLSPAEAGRWAELGNTLKHSNIDHKLYSK